MRNSVPEATLTLLVAYVLLSRRSHRAAATEPARRGLRA